MTVSRQTRLRVWPARVVRSSSRTTTTVNFGTQPYLVAADKVLFVQERMDNTAAGASVSSYMASAKFNGQFHFPAGSDTQALLEQIRASADAEGGGSRGEGASAHG